MFTKRQINIYMSKKKKYEPSNLIKKTVEYGAPAYLFQLNRKNNNVI